LLPAVLVGELLGEGEVRRLIVAGEKLPETRPVLPGE
jgi:hypothetical protein